jgi:RHS repeat-associated protein
VVDVNGIVQNSYTYNPFGEDLATEVTENTENNLKFTGQWWDSEIGQYYLRARIYDPVLMRFTGRDPVRGKFQEPMSLHKYLYCQNDPVDRIDPDGKFAGVAAALLIRAAIGMTIGGFSSYKMSGGDPWATAAGIITGGVAAMLGSPQAAISGLRLIGYGAGLGASTNAFALWRKNPNDDASIGYGLWVGTLTGGSIGALGTLSCVAGLDLKGGWSLASYATTEFLGWLWGENLWMPYKAARNYFKGPDE